MYNHLHKHSSPDRAALSFLAIFMACCMMDSCQRIEFEPLERPYITTDSIFSLEQGHYMLNGSVLNVGSKAIMEHGFCWSDIGTPTVDESYTGLGSRESAGEFSYVISGLQKRTTYYVRAYATTATETNYGNVASFRTPPPVIDSIISDIDGNQYRTVVIGSQAWMSENLRTTHYADGTPIPRVESDSSWNALNVNDKAYSWYDNDPSNASYGAYYTWPAAMNGASSTSGNPSKVQGVCPDGWHLPSDAEWTQMQIQLGMNPGEANNYGFLGTRARIGTKMKGFGDPLWENIEYNDPRLNESGFTALPCGLRTNTGIFDNLNRYAYFWSTTQFDENEAWYRYLQRGHSAILRVHHTKEMGYSVRCLMD